LVHSEFADTFILKGGVLLAALDARRPTRDIDFAVRVFEYSTEKVLSAVRTIAAIPLDDGMSFDSGGAAAEAIREEDSYSGIRVTLGGTLSRVWFDSTWTSMWAIPFGPSRSKLASRV
jgi:hypothetical protein